MNFEPIVIDEDALDITEEEEWNRSDERRRLRSFPSPSANQ